MPGPDRRHSAAVARRVERSLGERATRPVLAAALLHDVGKLDAHLRTYGRVVATLAGGVVGHDQAVIHQWTLTTGFTRRVGLYLLHPELGRRPVGRGRQRAPHRGVDPRAPPPGPTLDDRPGPGHAHSTTPTTIEPRARARRGGAAAGRLAPVRWGGGLPSSASWSLPDLGRAPFHHDHARERHQDLQELHRRPPRRQRRDRQRRVRLPGRRVGLGQEHVHPAPQQGGDAGGRPHLRGGQGHRRAVELEGPVPAPQHRLRLPGLQAAARPRRCSRTSPSPSR